MKIFDPKLTGSIEILNTITGNVTIAGDLNVEGSLGGAVTASATASYVEFDNIANKPTLISSSNQLANSTIDGDLTVTGTLTAQEFHTEFVSASIIYESGSTQFGDTSDDIHNFTGRIGIGTSDPQEELDIASAGPGIMLTDTDGGSARIINLGTDLIIQSDNDNLIDTSTIQIELDGTERMRINENGVGIGTFSPQEPFHVFSGLDNNVVLFESSDSTANILLTDISGSTRFRQSLSSFLIENDYNNSLADSNIIFRIDDSEVLHIDSNGYVGIGTTSPDRTLHVKSVSGLVSSKFESTTSQLIDLYGGGTFIGHRFHQDNEHRMSATYVTGSSGEYYQIGTNWQGGAEILTVDYGGSVGIGTSVPLSTLHIEEQTADPTILILDKAGTSSKGIKFNRNTETDASIIVNDQEDLVIGYNQAGLGDNFIVENSGSMAMKIDSNSNAGFGTTTIPTAWISDYSVVHIGNAGAMWSNITGEDDFQIGANAYWNGSSYVYMNDGFANRIILNNGNISFQTAPSGTAGDPFTFDISLYIKEGGNIGIGTTNPNANLDIYDGVPTIRLSDSIGCHHQIEGSGNGDLRLNVDAGNTGTLPSTFLIDIDGSNVLTLNASGDLSVTGTMDTVKVVHLKSNVTTDMVEGLANEFTVNFNLEEYRDTSYFTHSSGVITVLNAGWYRISANMVYQNGTDSARNTARAFVKKNGTEVKSTRTYDYDRGTIYGKYSNNKVDTMLLLAANDTVEIANYAVNEDGTMTIVGDECEFIVTLFR